MKNWLDDLFLSLSPLTHCILAVFAALVFDLIPVVWLFSHVRELGYFWIPLVLAYGALLFMIGYQLHRRVELLEERYYYGDEEYFKVYPHLKRMEERKLWRKALQEKLFSRRK